MTVVERGVPDTRRKRITPTNAKGTVIRISNGWVYELNCVARIR